MTDVVAHDDRHLSAESKHSTNPAALTEATYDYALLGSSWDRRCLSLLGAEFRTTMMQVLLPKNRGRTSLRDVHDQALIEFARSASDELHIIDEASENLPLVFEQIETVLGELRKRMDRPITMLIDLSAMPRYFTLGAIALGLNDSVAQFVDVFYAEAQYGDVLSTTDAIETRDLPPEWEAVAVPRLEGDWFPTDSRHFVVSVGFDAEPVARLIERWDPDRISVLFPRPGVSADYDTKAREANDVWMNEFELRESDVIAAPASDAVATWQQLGECGLEGAVSSNLYFLLCGTKPQALGATLYSLARERPAVMYVRPNLHKERDVWPNGNFWGFRIRDRTLVP